MDGVRHYVGILFRYKWMIFITTFCLTAAVVVFCAISVSLPPTESPLPNLYSAQATILIQQNNQTDIAGSILEALGVASGARVSNSFDNGGLVMEIFRSRTLLDRLIAEFNLAGRYGIRASVKGNTREVVLGKGFFQYTRNTGVMKISYTDIDPVFAQKVVNRWISLADEWFSQNRGQAKQKQQTMLEEKITAVKKDIATLKYRLKTMPDVDPLYSQYAAELDVQQRIYNTLSPQYEAAKLAPEIEPIFQVFEMAEIPDLKSGPQRSQYIIMAFALGFAGSSMMAFLLNALKAIKRSKLLKK